MPTGSTWKILDLVAGVRVTILLVSTGRHAMQKLSCEAVGSWRNRKRNEA